MAVDTPVEVDIGIVGMEQKHHMVAGIVAEVEVCHRAVVVASHTPTDHLVALGILVFAKKSRMPTDHLSAARPPLASPVVHNLVAAHLLAVEDTNLVESAERACQSAVELPRVPSCHHPSHVV